MCSHDGVSEYLSVISEFEGHKSIYRQKQYLKNFNVVAGLASWSSKISVNIAYMLYLLLRVKLKGNAPRIFTDRPDLIYVLDSDQFSAGFTKYFETETGLQAADEVKIATKNQIKKGNTEFDGEFQKVKIESNSQHSQLSQVAIRDRCGNPAQHSISCTVILGNASQKEKKGNNAGIDNETTVQLPPHPEPKPRVSAPKDSVTEKDFPTQNPLPSEQNTHRSFGDIICQESAISYHECENETVKAQNGNILEELPLSAKETIAIGKNELEIKNEHTSELQADKTENDLALSDSINDELKVERKNSCKPHHNTSEIRVRHKSKVDVDELKSKGNIDVIEVLESTKYIDNLEMAKGINELQSMNNVIEFKVVQVNKVIVCTQNGSEREVISIGKNTCGLNCAEINRVALGKQNDSLKNERFGSCSYVHKRSLLCCFEIYGMRLKFSFGGPRTGFQKVLNWRYRKKTKWR